MGPNTEDKLKNEIDRLRVEIERVTRERDDWYKEYHLVVTSRAEEWRKLEQERDDLCRENEYHKDAMNKLKKAIDAKECIIKGLELSYTLAKYDRG